jgi:hypothetical protein
MDDVDTSNQSSAKQSSNSKPVFAGSNVLLILVLPPFLAIARNFAQGALVKRKESKSDCELTNRQ